MELPLFECSCARCQRACQKKPGWFRPGEIEKTAELLGISTKELFDKYLAIDHYMTKERPTFTYALSPATKHMKPGMEFDYVPAGECVFYQGGKCQIHGAKPYECAITDHSPNPDKKLHLRMVEEWDAEGPKKQIEELLGRPPHKDFGVGGVAMSLMNAPATAVAFFLLTLQHSRSFPILMNMMSPIRQMVVMRAMLERMELDQELMGEIDDGGTETDDGLDGLSWLRE